MILRYIGGLILAAVILFATNWHFAQVGKARAEIQAAWDTEKLQAIATARIEDARRITAHEGIIRDANQKVQIALADAATARDASKRLRARVAALLARDPPGPTVAEGSAPAADPGNLLADVLAISDDRSGQLAQYADQARIAGEACERAYDALTVK